MVLIMPALINKHFNRFNLKQKTFFAHKFEDDYTLTIRLYSLITLTLHNYLNTLNMVLNFAKRE